MVVFTIVCGMQMSVGALLFIFGIIDRTGVQEQFSFIMLPIWIGIVAGAGGLGGLVIGILNRRNGLVNLVTAPLLKAINVMTVGLSLMSLLLYGSTLSYVGLRINYNIAYSNLDIDDPIRKKIFPMGKMNTPIDVQPSDETIQGIMGTIFFFSLVEMLLGSLIIVLDRESMVVQSSRAQQRVPVPTGAGQYQPQMSAPSQPPPPQAHPSQPPPPQAHPS